MIYLLCNPTCKCFIPFMENFEYILHKNNIEAKFITSFTETEDELFFVIWNDLERLPKKCIIYNMDPFVDHVKKSFEQLLERSPDSQILKIVDYSYGLNKDILSQYGFPIAQILYGYSSFHAYKKDEICGEIMEQPIDILFYGNISERRIPYIEELKKLAVDKNYNFVIHNNTLYDEFEKILTIATSKIIISIASSCTKKMQGNDFARISQVISSDGFVIMEKINEIIEYIPCFSTIEELIEKVDYYLDNPEERKKIIEKAKIQFPIDFNLEEVFIKEILEL
jgi:hypothetical protein